MKRILFLSSLLSLIGFNVPAEGIKDVECRVFSNFNLGGGPEMKVIIDDEGMAGRDSFKMMQCFGMP